MSYLLFLQTIREASAGVLDSFMLQLSSLGESMSIFLLLAFTYWCVDKRIGQLMGFNISFACSINQWAKKLFAVDRPWIRDERIHPVEAAIPGAGGASMPSGHTARAFAGWGTLGFELWRKSDKLKRVIAYLLMGIVALIMFSRNYLGVHTFGDVIVSLFIGIVIMLASGKLLAWVDVGDKDTDKKKIGRDVVVVVIACVFLLIPMLRYGCLSNTGFAYGFVISWFIERRFVRFSTKGDAVSKTIRFIPGALVTMALTSSGADIIARVIPEKYSGFFAQGAIAAWIICIYPLFIKVWEDKEISEGLRKRYKRLLAILMAVVILLVTCLAGIKIVHNIRLTNEEAMSSQEASANEQTVYGKITESSVHSEAPAINSEWVRGDVKVIAHRGYSSIAPENTIAAFQRAVDIGADMIELDVQLTKDGELIILHDGDLVRTTGIEGSPSAYTYDEIAGMDAGSWFNQTNIGMTTAGRADNYAGEPIPLLSEALECVKDSGLNVYLELKDITGDEGLTEEQRNEFAGKVVEVVNAADMADRVIYASFQYEYLKQIKAIDSDNLILCNTSIGDADTLLEEYPSDYYGLYVEALAEDTIAALHNAGRSAYVWTVDSPVQMRNVIAKGADGIVTNKPGVARIVVHNEYSFLADNWINTITIPGIYDYKLQESMYSYIMQGMTKVGNYIVISAYDYSGENNSVLYIMNSSGELLNIVDLGFRAHTGGTSYDIHHNLLWITAADGHVYALDWSKILDGTYSGEESEILVDFDAELYNTSGGHVASFLAVDGDNLYVGSYCDGSDGALNEYDIRDIAGIKLINQYVIPERIQGITFTHNEVEGTTELLLSQGYQTDDAALLSALWESGRIDYSEMGVKAILPEGIEQIQMTSDGLYMLFESAAREYRKTARVPNDQIWVVRY